MQTIICPQVILSQITQGSLQQNSSIRNILSMYSEVQNIEFRDALDYIKLSYDQIYFQLLIPQDLHIMLHNSRHFAKSYIDEKLFIINSQNGSSSFILRPVQNNKIIELHSDNCLLQSNRQINFGIINTINLSRNQSITLTSSKLFASSQFKQYQMNICASACFSKNRKLEEVQQYLISSIDKDIQEEIDKIGSELDQSVSEFVDLIGNQFPGYCVLTGNIIQPLKDKVSEINFREFSNYDAFLVAFLAEEDDI